MSPRVRLALVLGVVLLVVAVVAWQTVGNIDSRRADIRAETWCAINGIATDSLCRERWESAGRP